MEFNRGQAIYLQIADQICENILCGKWKEEERIPSVRDFAIELAVNPNTVMRTYTLLQEKNIIVNQRGVGFFVAEGGLERTRKYMVDHFTTIDLEYTFKMMDLLKISINDLKNYHSNYKQKIERGR